MTQKETPSTGPREAPRQIPPEQFLLRAEHIRSALGVSEDPGKWHAFLASINDLTAPPEGRYTLADTYSELNARRIEVVEALNLLIEFLDAGKEAPTDLIDVLRRGLVNYHVNQSLYLQRIKKIEDPQVPAVPKDLAIYVQFGEKEKTAHIFANIVLPTQYDVRKPMGIPEEVSPHSLSLYINEVVLHAMQRRTQMREVMAYLRAAPEQKEELLRNFGNTLGFPTWTDQGKQAALLLMGFLQKHQLEIERHSTNVLGKPLEELTITEALNVTLHASPVGEFASAISKYAEQIANQDYVGVMDSVRETLTKAATYSEASLQTALAPFFVELHPAASTEDRDQFRTDIRAVIEFFMLHPNRTGNVTYLENNLNGGLTGKEQRKYARKIVSDVIGSPESKQKTIQALKKALFISPSPGMFSWQEQRIAKEIENIIMNDQISMSEAFQIYYFTHVSKAGQLPLAMRTLDMMSDDSKYSRKVSIQAKHRLFRQYANFTADAAVKTDVLSALKKFDISPEEGEEIHNVALTLKERGYDEIYFVIYNVLENIWQFPEIYFAKAAWAGAVTVPIAAGIEVRRRISIAVERFERLANMTESNLKTKFGHDEHLFKKAQACRKQAIEIYNRYSRNKIRYPRRSEPAAPWHSLKERIDRRRTGTMLADFYKDLESKNLTDFLKILQREEPNIRVLIDIAEEFGEELPVIRKALQEIGFKPQEIAEAVKTRGIEKFTTQAQDIMDKIKQMEDIVNEPAKRSRALALIEESADTFRDEFNAFATEFPDARRTIAKSLADPSMEISEALFEALEKSHVQKRLADKVKIFWEAPISSEERKLAGRFIRLGLAGESEVLKLPRTLDELRAAVKGATQSDEALALIRRFAHADGIDPDAYRAFLRESDVQKTIGASEAVKMEKAAACAAKNLRSAKLWKIGGVVAGAAFGVLIDGILMHMTAKEIEEASKKGDNAQAELLRSKWWSQGGEAAFGAGTGGLAMAGVLAGPPGWVALGGLVAKSVSSEYLYSHAEDLNHTELKELLKKSEEELIGLLRGKGDWMVDTTITRERRYEIALDAYILKTHTPLFTALDERYMHEVVAELPVWSERNPYDPRVIEEMQRIILEEKMTKWRIAVREFLKETGGLESPSPRRIELAFAYANLKYLERRAHDLGDPRILHDALYPLKIHFPPEGIASVEPFDLLDDVKEHRAANILDQQKAEGLYYQLVTLRSLVDDGEIEKENALKQFLKEYATTFLLHDGNLFMSQSGESRKAQRPYQQTLNHILTEEGGPLFDAAENPEEFAQRALALREKIRTFLALGKPLERFERNRKDHLGG